MVYAVALLGFSLTVILVALFIAPKMDKYRDCLSIGDIIAKSYGKTAQIITGVFSMIICAGILGAQVGAMGAIFERFLNLPQM
jgi:SSS family solute:Na+ symporter